MSDKTNSRRTFSYASIADVNVVDGVLTSFTTAVTTTTHTAADFNGGAIVTGGVFKPSRALTVTRALGTGAYSTDPIVFTGKRGGVVVSASVAQATANGGDTLRTGILFDSLTSVAYPANAGTGGSYSIGVEDVGCVAGDAFLGVKMAAAGPSALTVAYDEAGAETDTMEATNAPEPIAARRITTANMTVGFTVYMP